LLPQSPQAGDQQHLVYYTAMITEGALKTYIGIWVDLKKALVARVRAEDFSY